MLNSIHTILHERKSNNFMSFKVKGLLAHHSSVLMFEACTLHDWSILRSGWLPWKSVLYLGGWIWVSHQMWCWSLYQIRRRESSRNWSCQGFWPGHQFEEIHREVQQWWPQWTTSEPAVDQIFGELQKHHMLLRITEDCPVCLCTSVTQCKCWNAEPEDQEEEPAFCRVTEGDSVCAI